MTLWILGGDARNRFAAAYLQENGCAVQTYGVPERPDAPLPTKFSHLILPFPSFAGNALRSRKEIKIDDILSCTASGTQIFGGLFGEHGDAFRQKGAKIYDFYGTEPLTTSNAVPTAEGAICLAIEHSDITLQGADCLVVGFGRCGKVLAQKLHALQANVTVGARSSADLSLAEAMGLRTDESGIWKYGLSHYDYIFNTVPAQIFSKEQLDGCKKTCLFIELASLPGGIAAENRVGLHYHFAPALPGKYAPKTAGILYAKAILKHLESEGLS